jgi:hypothetical protein
MTLQMVGEPHAADAGRGARWWSRGWRIFASNASIWMAMMLIYLAISWTLQRVPYLRDIGQWLLTPVFIGGLMLGCQSAERDATLRIAHLFAGFRGSHFGELAIIGMVNILLALAIVAIGATGVFGFVEATAMLRSGADVTTRLNSIIDAMSGKSLLAAALVFAIMTALALLNWFAPALVVLRGASAMQAMKLSSVGVLRNWVPFLVYGGVGIAIAIAAGVTVLGVLFILGASAISGLTVFVPSFGTVISVIVLWGLVAVGFGLVVVPVVVASTYAGYKDVFDG